MRKNEDREARARKELYTKIALASLAGSGAAYFATRKLPPAIIKIINRVDDVPVKQAAKKAAPASALEEFNNLNKGTGQKKGDVLAEFMQHNKPR